MYVRGWRIACMRMRIAQMLTFVFAQRATLYPQHEVVVHSDLLERGHRMAPFPAQRRTGRRPPEAHQVPA